MYKYQDNMLNFNKDNFVIPNYFPALLSGFTEGELNFRFLSDKRRNMKISGRFNIGHNFELFIIQAIKNYFKVDAKIKTIISKKEFSKKRKLLGEVKHYYLEMGSKNVKNAIFSHFSKYPLLGHKNVTYSR